MKDSAAAMTCLWFVVVPLALIALFIYHTRKKSHKKGPLELAGRFFSGAVNIPPGVVTVHDGKVYREDEGCHPEYHALYTPNSPEWKGYLPDVVPRVFVQWTLRDDDQSILRFNHRIPPEQRKWKNHLDYTLRDGVNIPTLDPARCHPQSREVNYVLRCIAEEFKKSPEPDLRPLQRYFGIHIHTIRKDPPPPPPPPPPDGVEIATGVWIETKQRPQHVYMLGRPESGKSTLMRSMVVQDLNAGKGLAVIDPHGDLIDSILENIPEERADEVIVFSPESLIPLNVFRADTEVEKDRLVSDVVALLQRLSDSWGPRMDTILKFAIRPLLDVKGASFLDLHRFLTDTPFRAHVLAAANLPPVTAYWENEYPTLPKDAAAPILSRMGQFVVSSALTKVLGRTSTLDFYEIMESGKVFLIDLATGKFGPGTSQLLGSLIVSQFQLAAMRRVNLKPEQRRPFYLYVDEFQNFRTSAFPVILSEARKYGLHLTIAHQYLYQLDEETRRAVLGTVGNRIFFALGVEDAKYVQPYIGSYDAAALLDFGTGDAILSPAKTSQSKKIRTKMFRTGGARAARADIIARSRAMGSAGEAGPPPSDDDQEPEPSRPPDSG